MTNKESFKINTLRTKKVKFGDSYLMIKPYIEPTLALYIISKSLEFYDNTRKNENTLIAMCSMDSMFRSLVVLHCTNLNPTDYELDKLESAGLFSILRDKIANYNEVSDRLHQILLLREFEATRDVLTQMPSLDSIAGDVISEFEKLIDKPDIKKILDRRNK